MLKEECYEGQWVRFLTTDTRDQFEGFIHSLQDRTARVAIPSIQATRSIPYKNLIDNEDIKYDKTMLDELVNVAIDVNDEDWLSELGRSLEVYNEWK